MAVGVGVAAGLGVLVGVGLSEVSGVCVGVGGGGGFRMSGQPGGFWIQ